MTAIDAYGALALLLILIVFYFVRRVPLYVASGAGITLGFAAVCFRLVEWPLVSNWLVMTAGLGACTFGLLIVRIMLIRSVSLNMLRGIRSSTGDVFDENIGSRIQDMQAFGLVAEQGGAQALTSFGRFAAGVVAVTYTLFRIKQ